MADVYTGDDLERAPADMRPDFVVDVTIATLAAGVPVLGQKPMADSNEEHPVILRQGVAMWNR